MSGQIFDTFEFKVDGENIRVTVTDTSTHGWDEDGEGIFSIPKRVNEIDALAFAMVNREGYRKGRKHGELEARAKLQSDLRQLLGAAAVPYIHEDNE